MLTVDRLVDGINGGDPGGARLYMSQLRENEVCFPDSSIQNAFPVRRFLTLRAASSLLALSLPPRRVHAFTRLSRLFFLVGYYCRCVEELLV